MKCNALTAERLRELVNYDSSTGIFTRLLNCKGGQLAGAETGHKPQALGYQRIMLDAVRYPAHRLAWLYVHGKWPDEFIDHINGIRDDNRIENLRDVSQEANAQNLKRAMRSNKSTGLLGVQREENHFVAKISIKSKRTYLGCFGTAEAAYAVYLNAKRRYHEGNTL